MTAASLGARLRAARQEAGLTQNQVARKLGVTYQAISNYERDKCRIESGILKQLCILYQITPVELLRASVWDSSQKELYAAARSEGDRLALFELWGVPEELAEEYAALSAGGESVSPPLSSGEAELLELYRRIPERQRGLVMEMLRAALHSQGLL